MRAGVTIFDDEVTLMMNFGHEEIMQLAHMVSTGESRVLPALDLMAMGNHFGAPLTHVQFVVSPNEETFDAFMNDLASALGIDEVREGGEYDPLNPGNPL